MTQCLSASLQSRKGTQRNSKYVSQRKKKKSTETISEKDIMADILHKDFKMIVLKMLKELKENGIKSRK